MTYPVVPDVPVGSITVSNVLAGHANTGNYVEPNADGSLNLAALPKITKVIPIKAQAITAATAVDVYTPTTGKKFNILAYSLSVSVAGAVIFEDGSAGSSAEILRTSSAAANSTTAAQLGSLGAGVASGTANNHIYLDVTASATVNGWIAISEL